MQTVGIIGIGDMGSGLAKNLINAGYAVRGHDPLPTRMADFTAMGGIACTNAAEVGQGSEAVLIMVMNGVQVKSVIFGDGDDAGLVSTMAPGSTILITATIKPREAREIAAALNDHDLHLIDSPVSGGRPGAQGGTLTLMASGTDAAFAAAKGPMQAISGTIHRVGTEIGEGQTVKACLQSLIGTIFTGAFEATALAAKAGVSGQVLYDVFSTSAAGCGITKAAIENVMDRKFEGTGSRIDTMHKDLTISLDLAMELGVPLFSTSTAMQLFQAGRTKYPTGDNQVVARISEDIVGTGLKR
jgi:putative dehydrogenase